MIDRYTIKVGPSCEPEGVGEGMHEDADLSHAHKLKARIELVGDFVDLKRIS